MARTIGYWKRRKASFESGGGKKAAELAIRSII
jgi:hypothetical protein